MFYSEKQVASTGWELLEEIRLTGAKKAFTIDDFKKFMEIYKTPNTTKQKIAGLTLRTYIEVDPKFKDELKPEELKDIMSLDIDEEFDREYQAVRDQYGLPEGVEDD